MGGEGPSGRGGDAGLVGIGANWGEDEAAAFEGEVELGMFVDGELVEDRLIDDEREGFANGG